jgi:hypothetical protein
MRVLPARCSNCGAHGTPVHFGYNCIQSAALHRRPCVGRRCYAQTRRAAPAPRHRRANLAPARARFFSLNLIRQGLIAAKASRSTWRPCQTISSRLLQTASFQVFPLDGKIVCREITADDELRKLRYLRAATEVKCRPQCPQRSTPLILDPLSRAPRGGFFYGGDMRRADPR